MLVLMLGCLAGCGGGSGSGAVDNGQNVTLGTFRTLEASDTWNYSLSWVHAGNTYTGRTATVAISQVGSEKVYTMTLLFGDPYRTEVFAFSFTQAGDGTLTLTGFRALDHDEIKEATTAVDTPAGNQFASENLVGTTEFDGRSLEINLTNGGSEEIDALDGKTYQCVKYDGTITEGGYAMDFTLWVNPSIGNVVKLVYSFEQVIGGEVSLLESTLLLSGKTLN